MSKTIQEQIEVMQHFANGGFINIKNILDDEWSACVNPQWNWNSYDYTIVEKKKTITIEKWLVQFDDGEYRIMHSSDIFKSSATKVKLLDTYEVEL